jgi:hypothetical protein
VRALAFLGVVGALASAASAAPPALELRVVAGASSATVTWTTATPTRGRVVFGVGALYLWSAREPAPVTSHSITLTDLLPSTRYVYAVAGTDASGELATTARSADARFTTDGARIEADGALFFPVLAYEQCVETIDRALAVGVNTFVQVPFTGCTQPAGITPPYVLGDDYEATRGAGWYLPDEPDGWGIPPDGLPNLPPPAETGKLRVLNVSQHFYSGQAPINDRFDRKDYERFAAKADVVGFDMYPIVKFCGRVPLLDVYRAQRELMTIVAPGKPTFQWIETSKMTGECATMSITPAIVNAETWLAVAGGACGIGYFTNSWTGDLWNRWDFDPGVEQQLAHTTADVERLAPALCTDVGKVVVPWDSAVAASSRALNGALYVVAVNSSAQATRIPLSVASLAGRTLTVLGEGRTITPVKKIYFRDSFEPYQVHVYVAAP